MTSIWIRAEQRPNEQRIGVTPEGVSKLLDAGFKVTIERDPARAISIQQFEKVRIICMYKQYPGDRYYYYSESADISTIHYGNEYTRIEVYPPVSFLDPKLGQSYILESNYKNLKL